MISARALVPMSNLQDAGNGQDAAVDFASPPANKRLRRSLEPTSVLYKRSPSPATSSAPPMSAEDWEALLSGDISIAAATTRCSQSQSHQGEEDSCFRAWLMDADADAAATAAFEFAPFLPPPPAAAAAAAAEQALLLQPMTTLLPAVAYYDDDLELEPRAAAAVDELLEAARRADAGDSTGAREILSRLNHHCNLHSPPTSPLLRDAALPPPSSPVDVALKLLAAHKALADASPTVFQFASFTSAQALLDALGGARWVHVVDMGGVGFGARWPPLMQELALQWRRRASATVTPPSMKVTALVSPPGPGSSAAPPHPLDLDLELHLTRQSLTRFAADLGIRFEFDAVAFDPLDPSPPVGFAPGEAVAVHLPVTSSLPLPAALRVVKQLRPAIVVCVDDMPLTTTSHRALNVVRWSAAFIESLHAAGAPPDAVANVEQNILRPRVLEMTMMPSSNGMIPWQAMFASAGLAPVHLSDAAEAQAECLVSRTHTTSSPGFHVDKRQGALALRWRQTELVTVSAWRCC